MKSVYDDNCLSELEVFALQKEFLEGRKTIELRSSQHSGQLPTPSTEINVNPVRTLIKDQFLTCQEMVAIMDCSNTRIKNMKKLHTRCTASMRVSHHLMKQKLWQEADIA